MSNFLQVPLRRVEGKNSAFRASSSSNDSLREHQQQQHPQLETSTASSLLGTPFSWSTLSTDAAAAASKSDYFMSTIPERPVALTAMTADAAAAASAAAAVAYDSRLIGASPYYNGGYPNANYAGMYAGSAQSYYPVASTLRASAAPFPFGSHAYYGTGNGYVSSTFDYGTYPGAVHCYGGRSAAAAAYYGCSINPVTSTPSSSAIYAINPLANNTSSNGSQQVASATTKNETKRKSAKRKKYHGFGSPDGHYKRAFIWEMEDISILSNSFLREQFANTINGSIQRIITAAFGFEINEHDCDYVNIEDTSVDDTISSDLGGYPTAITEPSKTSPLLSSSSNSMSTQNRSGIDWMRKLAAKYQSIKDIYSLYQNNCTGFLERGAIAERGELTALKASIDPVTQNWTENVTRCLKLIVDRSSPEHYANVLLTGENIVSTLAKLVIMEQSSTIPAENVYSTAKMGKEAVLDRIMSRFGKKCSFVIISTHQDTHEIARKENIPFWKVKNVRDLELFYLALNHHLLS